jgi:hypothetical protein
MREKVILIMFKGSAGVICDGSVKDNTSKRRMFTLMKFISKQYQENFMLNASADV